MPFSKSHPALLKFGKYLDSLKPYTTEIVSTENAVDASQIDDDVQLFRLEDLSPDNMHKALLWVNSDMEEVQLVNAITEAIPELIEVGLEEVIDDLGRDPVHVHGINSPSLKIDFEIKSASGLVNQMIKAMAIEQLVKDPKTPIEDMLHDVDPNSPSIFTDALEKWYRTKAGLIAWADELEIMFAVDGTPVLSY